MKTLLLRLVVVLLMLAAAPLLARETPDLGAAQDDPSVSDGAGASPALDGRDR